MENRGKKYIARTVGSPRMFNNINIKSTPNTQNEFPSVDENYFRYLSISIER